MNKNLALIILTIALSFATKSSIAQCDTVANLCYKNITAKYISDGQQYRALLLKGENAEFSATLFGGCVDTNINYESIINDTRHANNFSYFCNNPCSLEEIDEHYKNVYRDINNLSENKRYELNNKIINFLKNEFNNIIIKG